MDPGVPPRYFDRPCRAFRALALLVVALGCLGMASSASFVVVPVFHGLGTPALADGSDHSFAASNTTSTDATLCPSGGPTFLGVVWNCVAVLDLTEVALILVSIGIIAYVFSDADRAELPGDSAEVAVTAEEEAAYRRSREQGVPYEPANDEPSQEAH